MRLSDDPRAQNLRSGEPGESIGHFAERDIEQLLVGPFQQLWSPNGNQRNDAPFLFGVMVRSADDPVVGPVCQEQQLRAGDRTVDPHMEGERRRVGQLRELLEVREVSQGSLREQCHELSVRQRHEVPVR